MNTFSLVCDRLNVPIAKEKSVGPTTVLEYLGLTIDTVNMLVKIPDDKILELKEKMSFVLKSKKVILKVLQSLAGSLAFCSRAFVSGRVFSGRTYNAMKSTKCRNMILLKFLILAIFFNIICTLTTKTP